MPVPLAEHAAPVLKALADLLAKPDAADDCASLQQRLSGMLAAFERSAQDAGIALEHASQAKYALVALIDERIMLSELAAKDEWLSAPLQLALYDEVTAGEEFYVRLEAHRAARLTDVCEVYWLAMAFGFAGKFGDRKGAERRRALIDSLANEINAARGIDARAPLSPQASAAAAAVADLPRWPLLRLPWWLVPAAVAAAVLLTWLACSLYAGGLANDLERAAGGAP